MLQKKYKLISLILLIITFGLTTLNAQEIDLTTEKEVAPFGNQEKATTLGNVTYGPQPDAETVKMLKDKGYKMVLSVRFDDEPAKYDARKVIEENGMSFVQVSFYKGSIKDKERVVDEDAIAEISKILSGTSAAGSKVLMHCASGQRAAGALGAVLYRDHGYSKEEAFAFAVKAGLTSKNVGPALKKYMDSIDR